MQYVVIRNQFGEILTGLVGPFPTMDQAQSYAELTQDHMDQLGIKQVVTALRSPEFMPEVIHG